MRRSWSRLTIESSRRSSQSGRVIDATLLDQIVAGSRRTIPSAAETRIRASVSAPASRSRSAGSGPPSIGPSTASGPRRHVQHVVEEAVVLVPQIERVPRSAIALAM